MTLLRTASRLFRSLQPTGTRPARRGRICGLAVEELESRLVPTLTFNLTNLIPSTFVPGTLSGSVSMAIFGQAISGTLSGDNVYGVPDHMTGVLTFQQIPNVTNATATAAQPSVGEIKSVTINSGGAYPLPLKPVAIFSGGGGTGAAGTVVMSGTTAMSVTMTSFGSGYTSAPQVLIEDLLPEFSIPTSNLLEINDTAQSPLALVGAKLVFGVGGPTQQLQLPITGNSVPTPTPSDGNVNNAGLFYDYVEFAYGGATNVTDTQLDTSQVDKYGMPITMTSLTPLAATSPAAVGVIPPLAEVLSDYNTYIDSFGGATSPVAQAFGELAKVQAPYRIVAPNDFTAPAFTDVPDAFLTYFDSYISDLFNLYDPTINTVTTSATGTAGRYTITVPSAKGIDYGMTVTGTGIGTNATVTAINGTAVTLSLPNSAAVSGNLTFTPLLTMNGVAGAGGTGIGSSNLHTLMGQTEVMSGTDINGSTQNYRVLQLTDQQHPSDIYDVYEPFFATALNAAGTALFPNVTLASGVTGNSGVDTITVPNAEAAGILSGMNVTGTGIGMGAIVLGEKTGATTTTIFLSVNNSQEVSGSISFAAPQPPKYPSNINFSVPKDSPSTMTMAAAGVFADSAQQFPLGGNVNQQILLGAIENDMASALNRGIATNPASDWFYTSQFNAPIPDTAAGDATGTIKNQIMVNNGGTPLLAQNVNPGIGVTGTNIAPGTYILSLNPVATGTVNISGSKITSVTITSKGLYNPKFPPSVTFIPAAGDDITSGTNGTAIVNASGQVTGVTIDNTSNAGYTVGTTVVFGTCVNLSKNLTGAVSGQVSFSDAGLPNPFYNLHNPYNPKHTWNYYSSFFRSSDEIAIDNVAYALSYDDNGGWSTTMSAQFPAQTATSILITLGTAAQGSTLVRAHPDTISNQTVTLHLALTNATGNANVPVYLLAPKGFTFANGKNSDTLVTDANGDIDVPITFPDGQTSCDLTAFAGGLKFTFSVKLKSGILFGL